MNHDIYNKMITVREYRCTDLAYVVAIHGEAFPRQGYSEEWIRCTARAYPRMRYYVAESNDVISGYLLWVEKSGFREEVVLELEQIAVLAKFQNNGIGEALIKLSLNDVSSSIQARGAEVTTVLITTRSDNQAQRLYQRVLGAEVVATVPSLFSGNELLMLARAPFNLLLNQGTPPVGTAPVT